jgi:hypothetical protein
MNEEFVSLRTFMDSSDEKAFSESILKIHPGVIFIEGISWKNLNLPVKKSISEIINSNNEPNQIIILNTNIVSLKSYLNEHIYKYDDEYHGTSCGCGMITFNTSFLTDYEPGGLRNGELTAVIDPDFGIEAQQFVESIFSIIKNGSRKIYVFYPETGTVDQDREENQFFAWPSAIKNYDQVDGKYLTHNEWCYFTSKTKKYESKLIETEHPITENEFRIFESRFTNKIPESFKNHYLKDNGGYISEDDQEAGKCGLSYFHNFIPIKFGYIPIESESLEMDGIIPENHSVVGTWKKYEFVPFAFGDNVRLIFMSLRNNDYGSIYMFNEDGDNANCIFPSFDAFIKELYKIE